MDEEKLYGWIFLELEWDEWIMNFVYLNEYELVIIVVFCDIILLVMDMVGLVGDVKVLEFVEFIVKDIFSY